MSDRRFIIDVYGRNRLLRAHEALDRALTDTDMVSTWRMDLAGALIALARRLIGTEASRNPEGRRTL